jgi:Flp pilus assembly protein TadD
MRDMRRANAYLGASLPPRPDTTWCLMPMPSLLHRGRTLILTLVLCSAAGCGRYVQHHLDTGDNYFKQRKFRDAIGEYVKALRLEPDNWRGVRQIGLAYYQLTELKDAFAYLTKALTLHPNDPDVRVRVGNIYIANRQSKEALAQADSVLAIYPNNLEALSLRGAALMNTQEYAKAVEPYRRLAALNPKNPKSRYYFGASLLSSGDTASSRREFEAALALSPNYVDPIARLAEIDLASRRSDDAVARIKRQIVVNGRSAGLLNLLGAAYTVRGELASAEAAFLEAIQSAPNLPEPRVSLADIYAKSGRIDSAVAQLEQAIKVSPKHAPAHLLLGIIYQQQGDLAKARASYEDALAANPATVGAANNLAWLLSEKLGDPNRAFQLAEAAHQLSPNDPHVADTFGWILVKRGDFQRAVSVLKESAARVPADPGIQYHLGVASQAVGDTDSARRALRRAVDSPASFSDKEAARRALAALK